MTKDRCSIGLVPHLDFAQYPSEKELDRTSSFLSMVRISETF